jgi:predicted PurR-regulated permease PerM
MAAPPSWFPHPHVLRIAAYAACFVIVAMAVRFGLQLLGALGLVLFPVVVALFLTRVLSVPAGWLRTKGMGDGAATAITVVSFLVALVGFITLIAPPIVDEFRDLRPTVDEGLAEVEDWLVEDSGFDVSRRDIQDARDSLDERIDRIIEDNESEIAHGAQVALSGLAGVILAFILTIFAIKDGPRFQTWATGWVPESWREEAVVACRSGWAALGGYLRGATMLGIVEAIVIGGAMAIVGSGLVLPVMLLTFFAAFIPLVGAIVAGVVAVLVALATGGVVPALIVGIVAIVVQQLDNDILAPWIYGKSLSLHPAVVLLAITTGTALFGFVGTVLAVPLTATVITAVVDLRALRAEREGPGDRDGRADPGAAPATAPPPTVDAD